jgi:protein-S-isoprenylcysteine O-methyltransferase Ste14
MFLDDKYGRGGPVLTRVLPPTYFLASLALMVVLDFVVPLRETIPWPWRLVGVMPVVAGILLNVAADRAFTRHQTPVHPFARSTALVSGGVFGFTRNPMYLGMILALAGVALLLGSIAPWLVVAVLAVILDRVFVASEEQQLAANFAEGYARYRRSVRRWI